MGYTFKLMLFSNCKILLTLMENPDTVKEKYDESKKVLLGFK